MRRERDRETEGEKGDLLSNLPAIVARRLVNYYFYTNFGVACLPACLSLTSDSFPRDLNPLLVTFYSVLV